MKNLFLCLAALSLTLGCAYADYVILENELSPYAKSDEVVSSVHDLTRDVELEAGANVSITATNNTINIAAPGASAQAQSDWAESDTNSPAYIENKPTNVSSFSNDAGYITATDGSVRQAFTNGTAPGLVLSNLPYASFIGSALEAAPGMFWFGDYGQLIIKGGGDVSSGFTSLTLASQGVSSGSRPFISGDGFLAERLDVPSGYTIASTLTPDTLVHCVKDGSTPLDTHTYGFPTNSGTLALLGDVDAIASNVARRVVGILATDGWESDGTYYRLVVEPFVPPPPAETTFTIDGVEQTYDIVGALDWQWLVDNGFYDGTSYQWLVNITSVNIGTNVTSIGDYVFSRHGGLTSVTIPDSVTSIGDQAFNECSGLTSVMIPGSVTNIVASAFYKCTGLTNLTLLDGVTSIGGAAFNECSSLTSLTIPDSVTSIGSTAFYRCYGLTSATIGSGVTNIGWNAFGYCNNLMSVTMSGKTTTQVSGMSNYPWQLPSGCVITCSEGTITIP